MSKTQSALAPALQYTNQQLIDALYHAAHSQNLGDWALLEKAGLDVEELAADRDGAYGGTPIPTLPNLTEAERTLVSAALIAQLRRKPLRQGRVNAPAGLNVRVQPSAEANLLATLPDGTSLAVLQKLDDWLLVSTDEGLWGYVFGAFVADAAAAKRPTPPQPPRKPSGDSGAQLGAQSGYFAADETLLKAALEPEPAQRIRPGPAEGQGAQLLAKIWNANGGLLSELAARLQIDAAAAVAVLDVESAGVGFGADSRMIIRFENHLFYHHWGKQNQTRFFDHFTFDQSQPWVNHTWRPSTAQPFNEFHGSQPAEWLVLGFARSLNEQAAKLSISMGAPQILGSNHRRIGYASVDAMFEAFSRSERAHILGLFDFIRADGAMVQALRDGDYIAFAGVQWARPGSLLRRFDRQARHGLCQATPGANRRCRHASPGRSARARSDTRCSLAHSTHSAQPGGLHTSHEYNSRSDSRSRIHPDAPSQRQLRSQFPASAPAAGDDGPGVEGRLDRTH